MKLCYKIGIAATTLTSVLLIGLRANGQSIPTPPRASTAAKVEPSQKLSTDVKSTCDPNGNFWFGAFKTVFTPLSGSRPASADSSAKATSNQNHVQQPTVTANDLKKVEPHLKDAYEKTVQLQKDCQDSLQFTISQIRTSSRPKRFVKEVLTLSRKFNYATQSKSAFNSEISKLFESHLISPSEIDRTIEQALQDFFKRLEHIDNSLLVAVKSDVSGISSSVHFSSHSDAFKSNFSTLVNSVQRDISTEIETAIAQDICTYVTSEVISSSITSGLRKQGVIGKGAGSTATALLIDLFTDAIVDAVAEEIYSPEKELGKKLDTCLIKAEQSTAVKFGELLNDIASRRLDERRKILTQPVGAK